MLLFVWFTAVVHASMRQPKHYVLIIVEHRILWYKNSWNNTSKNGSSFLSFVNFWLNNTKRKRKSFLWKQSNVGWIGWMIETTKIGYVTILLTFRSKHPHLFFVYWLSSCNHSMKKIRMCCQFKTHFPSAKSQR